MDKLIKSIALVVGTFLIISLLEGCGTSLNLAKISEAELMKAPMPDQDESVKRLFIRPFSFDCGSWPSTEKVATLGKVATNSGLGIIGRFIPSIRGSWIRFHFDLTDLSSKKVTKAWLRLLITSGQNPKKFLQHIENGELTLFVGGDLEKIKVPGMYDMNIVFMIFENGQEVCASPPIIEKASVNEYPKDTPYYCLFAIKPDIINQYIENELKISLILSWSKDKVMHELERQRKSTDKFYSADISEDIHIAMPKHSIPKVSPVLIVDYLPTQ